MLIDGLGRTIQADREREIKERLRQRGLLRDAADSANLELEHTAVPGVDPLSIRNAGARSGFPAGSRPR